MLHGKIMQNLQCYINKLINFKISLTVLESLTNSCYLYQEEILNKGVNQFQFFL